jgi:hypothetical protein
MGQVRELAFNPIGTNNAGTKAYETAPNTVREEIFRNAGAGEIFGVTLHQLVELGVGQKYNTLFASLVTANGGVANTAKQILVGVDLTKESFIRPVARQAESGGTFTVLPDDQFVTRNEKTGFYGFLEEGRVCIDGRAVAGILV